MFLFSCYTWGNGGTKKLSHLPKVTQSLLAGHLTQWLCLQPLHDIVLWSEKAQHIQETERRPVWLEHGRGGERSYEVCQVEARAKPCDSWWANKKVGFYSKHTGKPFGKFEAGEWHWFFFFFFFFFWPHCVACGILVPQPGIKPIFSALGVKSLNHWTSREIPRLTVLKYYFDFCFWKDRVEVVLLIKKKK